MIKIFKKLTFEQIFIGMLGTLVIVIIIILVNIYKTIQ